MTKHLAFVVSFLAICVAPMSAAASPPPSFFDDFDDGASPLWGNERGNWTDAGGVYAAQAPSNNPLTLSSLPLELTDFAVDMDINGIADGGVYLRYDSTTDSGVLLVTGGGASGQTGLYWHTLVNGGITGTFGVASGLFATGADVHLRVEVEGNLYSAYLNESVTPATTLNTGDYPDGQVGLYDFSNQVFDNVRITPEPMTAAFLVFGAFLASRRAR